jgi:DNA-binding protein Fis
MQKPLREAINEVVADWMTDKLQRRQPVDVAHMAREISLCLVDMVIEQEDKNQGPLLAHIINNLTGEYLKGRGVTQARRRDN